VTGGAAPAPTPNGYVDTGMSCKRPEPGLQSVVMLPGMLGWLVRGAEMLSTMLRN